MQNSGCKGAANVSSGQPFCLGTNGLFDSAAKNCVSAGWHWDDGQGKYGRKILWATHDVRASYVPRATLPVTCQHCDSTKSRGHDFVPGIECSGIYRYRPVASSQSQCGTER